MLQKKQSSYYLFFYIISLTIYGLLSTSTPDKITIVEILIGFSLLIVVGLEGLSELMKSDKYSDEHDFKVPNIVKFSFFYLIFLPSLYGLVFFENSIKNWIRDIIPLLYLFLPLLVIKKINFASRSLFLYSILLLCLVGASFSIRFFFDSVGSLSNLGTSQIIALNKDNIALDPATQFFLSFTSCFSVWLLMRGKIFFGIIILIISFLPWAVVIGVISRAPIFFTFFSIFFTIFYWIILNENKKIGALFLIILLIILIYFNNFYNYFFKNTLELLIQKNIRYGLNTRGIEFDVVMNSLNSNIFKFFFGNGWGSLIEIPNMYILRNLHNVFLYFTYKTGFFGLICILIYFIWIIKLVLLIGFKNKFFLIVMISMINPLVNTALLQPMFKSLSFGVLILLIPLMYNLRKKNDFDKYI